jgi:Uma2 family endonuclease
MTVGGEAVAATARPIPPLESGDRLTRAEFHRRYCAHPEIKKAELVEGVVYVASPTRFGVHGKQHGWMVGWLYAYVARTPEVQLANNATVLLDADNELQPDACLFREPPPPGGARLTDDDYIEGPPHLVVEVAASSASYDLHDKMLAYRRAGVPEYIVWQVLEHRIDWFRLREGAYIRVEPDRNGIIESAAFPGLRLNVPAMLGGDNAAVLAALEG